jgi:hypothetical protein
LVGAAGSVETAGLQEKTMKVVTKFASTVLPIAAVAGMAAVVTLAISAVTPAAAATHYVKGAVHYAGRPLYNVAPQSRAPVNSDDPALTGGGSIGYNQNIYNW